jgi:hypothetical protein
MSRLLNNPRHPGITGVEILKLHCIFIKLYGELSDHSPKLGQTYIFFNLKYLLEKIGV